MNVIELLIVFLIPALTLAFTLRFKGFMAVILVAPAAMLLIAVFMLNADPSITIIYPSPGNSTTASNIPQAFTTTITSNVPNLVTHVLITNSTNSVLVNSAASGDIFAGEKLDVNSTLIGEKLDTISLKLSRTGNPTGTYEIGVWDSSFSPKQIFCTPTANALLTSGTFITCRLPVGTYYTMIAGDYIGISYSGSAGSTGVNLYYVNSDYFDGANTHKSIRSVAGVWSDQLTEDATIALYFNDVAAAITSVESTVYNDINQISRTEFDSGGAPVSYPISPEIMTVTNYMAMTVAGVLGFIMFRRITKDKNKETED
jgi:hypothetical protein